MKRILPTMLLMILEAGLLFGQEPPADHTALPFQEPQIVDMGPFAFLAPSVGPFGGIGFAAVEPLVDVQGRVESVKVIRATTGMESWAVNLVKSWKFRAATIRGKPTLSRAAVVLLFNYGVYTPPAFALPSPVEHSGENDEDLRRWGDVHGDKLASYSPALPTEVIVPEYPVMSALTTAIVMRVALDAKGEIDSVSPMREVPVFSSRAVEAVKKWGFSPAAYEGQAVPSQVTVAIFFEPYSVN